MRICLASTSPARLALLRQAGIEPELRAPGVDEEAVTAREAAVRGPLTPEETVLLLAQAKAGDVVTSLERDDPGFDGIVIGGDSVFALDGIVYGKPHTAEEATRRWRLMRGHTGVLHSGHTVYRIQPGQASRQLTAHAQASVSFASDVSDEEIAAYVASGEPLFVAGAFTVDSLGAAFIERVEGDPSTVVGMSLSLLRSLLGQLGVRWTDLWSADGTAAS